MALKTHPPQQKDQTQRPEQPEPKQQRSDKLNSLRSNLGACWKRTWETRKTETSNKKATTAKANAGPSREWRWRLKKGGRRSGDKIKLCNLRFGLQQGLVVDLAVDRPLVFAVVGFLVAVLVLLVVIGFAVAGRR